MNGLYDSEIFNIDFQNETDILKRIKLIRRSRRFLTLWMSIVKHQPGNLRRAHAGRVLKSAYDRKLIDASFYYSRLVAQW